MSLRVVLAEDHLVVREGVKALLESEGVEVVGEASDGQEACRLAHDLRPDVAILDLGMPTLNGLDAARKIRRTLPDVRVIILTMHTHERYLLEALRAGVTGYVLKSGAVGDLVQALGAVMQGMVYLSPGLPRTAVEALQSRKAIRSPKDPLSPRERQVLQLVAEGKTTRGVADAIGVSPKTAETHRLNLMKKLDIHDTAGLVRYAIERGIVQT
jgi:DNA-binding NarL/FixJ family response regulator